MRERFGTWASVFHQTEIRETTNRVVRVSAAPRLNNLYRRAHWHLLTRAEFHGLMHSIRGKELRAQPGPVRRFWHRHRLEAVAYYEAHYGSVAPAWRHWRMLEGRAFFRSPGFQQWSRSAYDPPLRTATLEGTLARLGEE